MVKVRKCSIDDVTWLVNLAQEFNDNHFGIPINRQKTRDYLWTMVKTGTCFRTDNAAIVGMLVSDPFRDWSVLVEIGWFSNHPGEGMALLDRFILEGIVLHVDEVRMTTLHSNPGVAAVLKRKGFDPVETSHRLIM